MSWSEYHDQLLKIGMGWLGWTEAETLDSTMSGILLAYEGRVEFLRSIFGGRKPTPEAQADAPSLKAALRFLGGGKKRKKRT